MFTVVGWVLVQLFDRLVGRLLPVPPAAAAGLLLMALFLLVWGLMAKPRLQRAPGKPPLDPIVAARTAALALAASRTGALVMGFYVGVALGMVPYLQAPAGRAYLGAAVAAAVASLLLAAVGLWLERVCRIRDDDDADGGAVEAGA